MDREANPCRIPVDRNAQGGDQQRVPFLGFQPSQIPARCRRISRSGLAPNSELSVPKDWGTWLNHAASAYPPYFGASWMALPVLLHDRGSGSSAHFIKACHRAGRTAILACRHQSSSREKIRENKQPRGGMSSMGFDFEQSCASVAQTRHT